jgi:hypothetical protein
MEESPEAFRKGMIASEIVWLGLDGCRASLLVSRPRKTPAKATRAMTAAAIRIVFLLPAGGAAGGGRLVKVGEDASESANARSAADWNRSSRSFSKQCLKT